MKRLLPILLLLAACRKTDSYYTQLSNNPEIYTAVGQDYSRLGNGNPRQYYYGDTLSILGRFQATAAQVSIQIAGQNVPVLSVKDNPSTATYNHVTSNTEIDTIQVVLANTLGTGRLTVNVNCRGFLLNGPLLNLLPKGNLPAIADTLIWRQLLTFQAWGSVGTNASGQIVETGPAVDSFLVNPVFYPSFSGTGNIFFSKGTSIRLLHSDGSITPVATLNNLNDAGGPFTIQKMYNGAVDQQEHYLYFSCMTLDSRSDTVGNWVFRFCKLDLQANTLQVMNRTLFPRTVKGYNAIGTSAAIQAYYAQEGDISQVRMLACSKVWADNQGNVYFNTVNYYSNNSDGAGNWEFFPAIYDNFRSTYFGHITPSGQVQYIFKVKADWPGAGASILQPSGNIILSLDPVKGLMYTLTGVTKGSTINVYDLNGRSVIAKLDPTTAGIGGVGPFNLLDPITTSTPDNINYGGLGGDPGRYLALPGTGNRFLYDLQDLVYDFTASQTYYYAPVILDSTGANVPKGQTYDPSAANRADLPAGVLNYDQQGNIYKVALWYQAFNPSGFFYDVRRTKPLHQ